MSKRGIVIALAKERGGIVSRSDINSFFDIIGESAPNNTVLLQDDSLLFYEEDVFIPTELVDLSVSRCSTINEMLEKLFKTERQDYIMPRDISDTFWDKLPRISGDLHWTPLLLQEVIRVTPGNIDYRMIGSGLKQARDTIAAAIVPKDSYIMSFADLVQLFCSKHHHLPRTMSAEELRLELRDAGMIAGNELISNMHKALNDYRFSFTDNDAIVSISEKI